MAQKLGIFNQLMWGKWADRDAINKNADALESVEATVTNLQEIVTQQAQEILRLRAMIAGVVEVLQTKLPIDDAEVENAVNAAWAELAPPPPQSPPHSTDPYRNLAASDEATPEDVEAAKALLAAAQDHHFSKEFDEARAVYQEIIEKYGATKQAAVAQQQLANLR